MKESKKRRRKQPGKLMANSRSQLVNLPVAQAGQFAHCPALNEPPERLIELTQYQCTYFNFNAVLFYFPLFAVGISLPFFV